MKYLKLYEEFKEYEEEILEEEPITKNSKNKDLTDLLGNKSLLGKEEIQDFGSFVDKRGIIHIKNWKIY